ncbi:hypothetical protein PQX77_003540 [Marasmius sp. AFHP31]|nr:hypothetical protein PQX77_003540 [Marasmius sp. AFHP31]
MTYLNPASDSERLMVPDTLWTTYSSIWYTPNSTPLLKSGRTSDSHGTSTYPAYIAMQTRSSKRNATKLNQVEAEFSSADSAMVEDIDDVEASLEHLGRFSPSNDQAKNLLKSVKSMRKEIKYLHEQNSELRQKLELEDHVSETRSRAQARPDLKELPSLKKQIRTLKKANVKAREKIEALRQREARKDADELLDNAGEFGVDVAHQMRELLRRFSDLMAINTLDEGEECPICMEQMQVNEASSFECQHLVCNVCLDGLFEAKGDPTPCPHCRKGCPRDTAENVQYTATQRWDMLLECAAAWEALDSGERGEDDTDEAERSEHSDENEGKHKTGRATSEESARKDSDSDTNEGPSTPPDNGSNYSGLASPQKRARLEQLAAERELKKRRK